MSYHLVPTRYVEVVTINETATQKQRFIDQLSFLADLKQLITTVLIHLGFITEVDLDEQNIGEH